MAYHNQQGVDTAIVRIFNTYGPRMRAARRPRDPDLRPPGARERAADGLRRRLADAELLLRRRPRSAGSSLLAESGEHLPVNIGNPGEFTILELAETVLRVTGSTSEIVFEALPVDDPQVRQPDITRARQVLGWEPEIELEEGLRRMLARLYGRRAGRCLARLAGRGGDARAPPPVSACPRRGAARGHARRDLRRGRDVLRRPGAGLPAVPGAATSGAPRQPLLGRHARRREVAAVRRATDPATPAYDWSLYDRTVNYAGAVRDQACSSRSTGTPRWANGGAGAERPADELSPTCATSPTRPRRATAARTPAPDGRDAPAGAALGGVERAEQPGLPPAAVRAASAGSWVIQSAIDYAKICNAIYSGVHATLHQGREGRLRRDRAAREQQPDVARGRRSSPLAFLRGAQEGGAEARSTPTRTTRTTARHETPTTKPPSTTPAAPTAITLANINVLIARAHAPVRAASGSGSPSTATRRIRPTAPSASPGRSRRAYLTQALRDRAQEPAHRHDALVPRSGTSRASAAGSRV